MKSTSHRLSDTVATILVNFFIKVTYWCGLKPLQPENDVQIYDIFDKKTSRGE